MLEALWLLAACKLALRLLPFRTAVRLLARPGRAGRAAAGAASPRQVVRSVDALSGPLRATCLPRALTAHALLTRRGVMSELRIGVVRHPGKPLEAHAWVEDAGGVLIGGLPDLSRFVAFSDLTPALERRRA